MSTLVHKFSTTRIKIKIAKVLYWVTTAIFGSEPRVISRGNIKYEVDLSEGIDLSLFLFGSFQKHIFNKRLLSIRNDAVIFDVGANFGALSLRFAQLAPQGKVFAFEPTTYALERLKKNFALNPALSERIVVVNSFVSSASSQSPGLDAFSSWKVGGKNQGSTHPVHFGTAMPATGVPAVSLDDFCATNQIARIDFIKIDTDGHEHEVLKGAQRVIASLLPTVIFEIGLYIMKEKKIDFSFYNDYFSRLHYELFDLQTGARVSLENHIAHIPSQGTTDLVAIPIQKN